MIRAEKIIWKSKLDALIEIEREHYETPYEEGLSKELCNKAIEAAKAIEDSTKGIGWMHIRDFVSSLIFCLSPGITNDAFYFLLENMGWVIADDGE